MVEGRRFKDAAYAHLAQVGKALGSPARLEILALLAQAPRTVEVLARAIGKTVANTSQHLQTLKRARLVSSTREGAHVRYALSGEDVGALLDELHAVGGRHVAELDRLTREVFRDRDGLEPVDRDTLVARLRADEVLLLDVRPEHEFEQGHVPGALGIPLDALEARLAELPEDKVIVAYCRGPFCTFSADAARRLRELGYDARRTDASAHALVRAVAS